ncbi:MAG: hypothetical protein ACI9IT_002333, partial [Glaciecola sp.]
HIFVLEDKAETAILALVALSRRPSFTAG